MDKQSLAREVVSWGPWQAVYWCRSCLRLLRDENTDPWAWHTPEHILSVCPHCGELSNVATGARRRSYGEHPVTARWWVRWFTQVPFIVFEYRLPDTIAGWEQP